MKEKGSTGLNLQACLSTLSTGCPQPSSLLVKWLADGSRRDMLLGNHGAKVKDVCSFCSSISKRALGFAAELFLFQMSCDRKSAGYSISCT